MIDLFYILNNHSAEKLYMEVNQFSLSAGKKNFFLRKGSGWRESYFKKIIHPLINNTLPLNAQQVNSSKNIQCWNVDIVRIIYNRNNV